VQSPHSATTVIKPLLNTNGFIVKVTSASGCVLYDTVHVTLAGVAPRVSIQPSNNNVCPGDTITLNTTILVANLVSCGLVDTCPDNTLLSSQAVGTGGSATDITTSYPGEYPAAKAQYLITAAEMNAAGLSSGAITDISFFVTQINSTVGYDSFTVSMGCTTQDSLTGFVNTLQEVAPAVQVFPNLGWTPHPFTHFYDWDGVSNIVIQICYTRTSSNFNNSDYVTYTSTPYSGSVAYAESFGSGVNGCSLNAPTLSNQRPNIKIGMCSPNTLKYTWSPPTLLCDTCPVTQVAVTADSTYTLLVSDGGCTNDSTVRVTINPYVNLVATPDTSLCNHDTAQLNVSMVTPAPSLCLQNYNVTSIPYASIAGAAITIPSASYKDQFGNTDDFDGTAGPLNVGFSAPFYCESFTQFWVNANGWISFVNPYPATTGAALNTAQTFPPAAGDLNPQKEIAFVVGDYALAGATFGGGGHVSYFTTGTTPNRTLVIKFVGIQEYFGAANNTSTGEIHVHETTGVIEIMISSSNYPFDSHTTGLKDTTGVGVAAPGRNNTPYTITTAEGWRFTPQNGPNSIIQNVVWSPSAGLSNDSIRNPRAAPTVTTNYIANTNVLINQFTAPEVCHVKDTVTVKVGSFPHSLSASPSIICTGTTSQLTFSSPDSVSSYVWSPSSNLSGTTIRNPIATAYDTTTFYVVAGDTTGCHVRDSVVVYTYPHPHKSIGNDTTVCYNGSVTLSLAGSSGTYAWFSVDTTTGHLTQIATTPTITGVPSHYYVLQLLDSATSCLYFTDTVHVDSFAHPLLGITASGPLAFCTGGNVLLQADPGYTGYNWTPAGGATQSVPVSTSGDYSYTATDAHGCARVSVIDTVAVTSPPAITFVHYRPTICSGNTDSVIITTSPAGTPVQWQLAGTQVATGDTFTTTTGGTYDVIASAGCPTDSTFTLTVASNPTVAFSPAVINACACGTSIPVNPVVTPPSASDTYAWSTGATGLPYSVDTTGIYTVTVIDANQCTATASITATLTCPQVTTAAIPDTIFLSDTTTLFAKPVGSTMITTYLWTAGDSAGTILSPASSSTQITSSHQGIDTFYVTVTDNNNCTNTVPVIVTVIELGGLRMPTAFTPNGDHMNDTFYPVLAAGSRVTTFRIYNRWGELVYNNPSQGWDGLYGDKPQATDTYLYFVTVESPDPNDATKKIQKSIEGNFQLFR
jgi:gliding motility-associated-like protein